MGGKQPAWLVTTVNAVREVIARRLAGPLEGAARREVEMVASTLDLLWEQLEGETEHLAREHERYSEFFDNAPDAFLITDPGGNVLEANRCASELFGVQMHGRPLASFLPEDQKTRFLARFIGVITGCTSASWETSIIARDGRTLRVQLGVRPIPLARSGAPGLCWVVRPLD